MKLTEIQKDAITKRADKLANTVHNYTKTIKYNGVEFRVHNIKGRTNGIPTIFISHVKSDRLVYVQIGQDIPEYREFGGSLKAGR